MIFLKSPFLRIVLVSVFSYLMILLVIYLLDCEFCEPSIEDIIFTILSYNLVSEGNIMISKYLDKHRLKGTPLSKAPNRQVLKRRFILQIMASIGWTLLVAFSFFFVFKSFHDKQVFYSFDFFLRFFTLMLAFGLFIVMIINQLILTQSFGIRWIDSVSEYKELEKEKLKADYQKLQDQLNPNFLFNCFRDLTHEIEHHRESSIKYVQKLSDIYEYVLECSEKKKVPLEEELNFSESYIYLQNFKCNGSIEYQINIDFKYFEWMVPPFALQSLSEMLINDLRVKENDVLSIHMCNAEQGDNLWFKAEYKSGRSITINEESLKRLEMRYAFFTKNKIEYESSPHKFKLKLPLLPKQSQ